MSSMRSFVCTGLAAILVLPALAPAAAAQDWTQWRGPNRDGVAAAFDVPVPWPDGLRQRWAVEVGSGYATPLLIGERLYLYVRQAEDEVLLALDPATGETIWRAAYPAPYEMSPATNPHGPGPKSTPAYAAGRLFTLGMSGIVSAFDADDGELLWQVPGGTVEPLYHTAMSPVVEGDLVIFHVGGHDAGALTAFDTATGDVRWSWNGDGPSYGSPLVLDIEGVRQVVTYTQDNLVGVDVRTGELLWSRPFTTAYTTNSQTPIRHGDLLIQSGQGNGVTAFRVLREGDAWTTDDVWHAREVALDMTNGVVADGVLFGLSHLNSGQYFALDLDTGEVLWTGNPRQAQNAAILRSGGTLLSLQDDAALLVLSASRTGLDVVERYDVADSATWTQPTLSGNRLFVKDVATLTLWTLD